MTGAEQVELSRKASVKTVYFSKKGPTKTQPSRITWHAHHTKRGEAAAHHSTHRTERGAREALGWKGGSDDPSFWPDDDYISTGR